MEKKIQRGDYWFIGNGAEASAHYYDIVISHGYDGDLLYLAWDSARKFGQRMLGENIASFRDGIVRGPLAHEAAVYIDQKRDEVYSSLPEFNRSKLLKILMQEHFQYAEEHYNVSFEKM